MRSVEKCSVPMRSVEKRSVEKRSVEKPSVEGDEYPARGFSIAQSSQRVWQILEATDFPNNRLHLPVPNKVNDS